MKRFIVIDSFDVKPGWTTSLETGRWFVLEPRLQPDETIPVEQTVLLHRPELSPLPARITRIRVNPDSVLAIQFEDELTNEDVPRLSSFTVPP